MKLTHNDHLIKQNNIFNYNDSILNKDNLLFNNNYDEPTYLTIRIDFFPDYFFKRNNLSEFASYTENSSTYLTYNNMPNPLFDYNGDYSTHKYLMNNLGEKHRANLLEELIKGFADLTWRCPYYITSVDGLNDIISVDPKRGTRVKQDAVITLKCIEGLDMRINALMNMYKKIAWDDVYQRWILPDMMRYFKMNIYISEFRIFHESKNRSSNNFERKALNNGKKFNTLKTLNSLADKVKKLSGASAETLQSSFSLLNSSINDLIPTICFECSMCEFDISDIFSNLSSINISDPKQNQTESEIKIKVGNIKEKTSYGLFLNDVYLHDDDFIDKSLNDDNNLLMSIKHAADFNYNSRTGLDYNEALTQETELFNENISTKPTTYLGNVLKNTVENATSWLDNKADNLINKATNKRLIGGMSVNDMLNAAGSENIFSMINTISNKAALIKRNYPEVSAATNNNIDITLFEDILDNISKSNATDETSTLIKDIAADLLEYGKNNNLNSIDEYIKTIKKVVNDIEPSAATSNFNKNNKIAL